MTDTVTEIVESTENVLSMRWYILHTTPGHENKVREKILLRAAEAGMANHFSQVLVPSEEVSEVKNGKKVSTTRRLYPGYVFIEIHFNDAVWHLIRKTPSVTGFVGGTENRPAPMKQAEIDKILHQMTQTQDKPAPKVLYEIGEIVRVSSGPFKDFNAAVAQIDYEKGKLTVMVTVFGRETPIEISFSDVEKM